ncbi:MAG: hypothetical protein FD153_2023 [Rhodospirillaceae bacterium]|nr:MAG: hypothetical protein FD153_2023 [Rhodospirillaceae bacterium]
MSQAECMGTAVLNGDDTGSRNGNLVPPPLRGGGGGGGGRATFRFPPCQLGPLLFDQTALLNFQYGHTMVGRKGQKHADDERNGHEKQPAGGGGSIDIGDH